MQAKINQMKNAFAEMSLAMGKAFVSDSLVALVQGLTGLATAGAHVVQTFGGLPSLITAAYVAFMLFGGGARKYVTSMVGVNSVTKLYESIVGDMRGTMVALRATIEEETVGMTGLSRTLTIAGISARAFGMMFKEALIGTGVGIAIVGASILVEKLIQSYSDAQAKQRQLKEQQDQLTQSFNNNKDTIKTLANQYEILGQQSDSLKQGTQDNKDYLSVQKRLGNLLPSVVDNIDAMGQAHLKSADAVKQEIAQLDKLNNLKSTKFVDDFSKSLGDINKKINDTRISIDNIGKTAYSGYGTSIDVVGQQGSLSTDDKINKIMDNMQLQQQIQQRVDLFKQLSTEYAKSIGVENKLTNADKEYLNQLVDNNKAQLASKDGAKKFQDQLETTISIIGDLRSVVGNGIDVSKLFPDLSKNTSEQEKQLAVIDDSIKKFQDGSINAKGFADALSLVGISGSKAKDILKILTTVQNDNTDSLNSQADAQKTLQGLIDGTTKLEDVLAQSVTGYTNKEIDQQGQLIQLYNALSNIRNKNSAQIELQKQVLQELLKYMPEEVQGSKATIKSIADEIDARKVMSLAAVDSANNRLKAEAQVTYGLALQAQKQEQIIKDMIKNYEALMMAASYKTGKDGAIAMDGVAMYWYNQIKAAESQLSSVHASYIGDTVKLAKEMNYSVPMPNSDFPSGGTSSSSGSSKSKKGSSGSGSSSSNPVAQYTSDKSQQALDALNLKLNELQNKLGTLDKTSKAYSDTLAQINNNLSQQKKINQDEIDSLNKQDNAMQKQLKSMGAFNKLSDANKQKYNQLAQSIDQNKSKVGQLQGTIDGLNQSIQQNNDEIDQNKIDSLLKPKNDKIAANNKALDAVNSQLNMYQYSESTDIGEQVKLLGQKQALLVDNAKQDQAALNSLEAQKQKYKDNSKELAYINSQIDTYTSSLNSANEALVQNGQQMLDIRENAITDYYNKEIQGEQDKLNLLNQQIQAQQQLNQLQDLQNQLTTAMNDKRYSYIDANGKETLTYDKSKVADLQKQISDAQTQMQQQAEQQAIQDQITALQKQETDAVNNAKKQWADLVKSFEDGKITYDQFMKAFYNDSLTDLKTYTGGVSSQIDQLTAEYQQLLTLAGSVGSTTVPTKPTTTPIKPTTTPSKPTTTPSKPSTPTPPKSSTPSTTSYTVKSGDTLSELAVKNKTTVSELEKLNPSIKNADKIYAGTTIKLPKYHVGGVVEDSPNRLTQLVNKFLNTKLNPNESAIVALKGELLSPALNIAQNFIPNMATLFNGMMPANATANVTNHNYSLNNVTIKADNPTQFAEMIQQMAFTTSSRRT